MPTIELWLGLNCRDGLHLLPVNDGAGAQAGHLHGPNRDDDGAYCDLHDHRDEYRLRQHWPFETAPLSPACCVRSHAYNRSSQLEWGFNHRRSRISGNTDYGTYAAGQGKREG